MLCAKVKVSAEIYEKIMPNRPRVRDTALPRTAFFLLVSKRINSVLNYVREQAATHICAYPL